MCNYIPLRNLLIALCAAMAAAISSAVLALILMAMLPWVASICFWAAATWCTVAVVLASFAIGALTTFYACASHIEKCASIGRSLRAALDFALPIMLVGLVICIIAALGSVVQGAVAFVFVIAGLGALGSLISLAAQTSVLASCQISDTPLPMPPPGAPEPNPS